MTDEPTHEPTTVSQDLLAAALGALMPLGAGLLILIGYALLGIFGAVVGAAAAIACGLWWRNKHGEFFPTDLRGSTVGGVAVAVVVLGVVSFLSL